MRRGQDGDHRWRACARSGYRAPVAAASALTLAQVGEFSFVLDRAGQAVGLSPAGLGDTGSQAFIAAIGDADGGDAAADRRSARALAQRLERRRVASDAAAAARRGASPPRRFAHLQHHVIVAGYGEAARQLVRVLHGSRVPFVITTLSPGGANEAEAPGLPVLRGDSGRQHTLLAAGIERASDGGRCRRRPGDGASRSSRWRDRWRRRRASSSGRGIRARWPRCEQAGADLVVAEELESVVQLFADVLRTYKTDPAEIERHEAALRRGGYAALVRRGPRRRPRMSPRSRDDIDTGRHRSR